RLQKLYLQSGPQFWRTVGHLGQTRIIGGPKLHVSAVQPQYRIRQVVNRPKDLAGDHGVDAPILADRMAVSLDGKLEVGQIPAPISVADPADLHRVLREAGSVLDLGKPGGLVLLLEQILNEQNVQPLVRTAD